MGRTLEELGATMTSEEFELWAALYDVDPWDEHADLGFGRVCATIANHSGRIRPDGAEPAVAADYMPLPRSKVVEEPDPVKFFSAIGEQSWH